MEPAFFRGHCIVGCILLSEKKYAEAQPLLETAVRLYPYYFGNWRELGTLYWRMGNEDKCREMITEMELLAKKQVISNCEFGLMYTYMGEFEIAAGYFEKGIEKREGLMLFARDNIRFVDEKMYVPQIEMVLEKVEAFKRNN